MQIPVVQPHVGNLKRVRDHEAMQRFAHNQFALADACKDILAIGRARVNQQPVQGQC